MIPACIAICILAAVYGLLFLGNRRFTVTHDVIRSAKIRKPFRVVQVSDLHDRSFGEAQCRLLDAIRSEKPDLIVITGDLFNRHDSGACRNAYRFAGQVISIAPTYFAEGNHEASLGKTGKRYVKTIASMGVRVLRNAYTDLPECRLIGLKQRAGANALRILTAPDRLNLVLAHRPELIGEYAKAGADVVLSGHAHGGQIRIFRKGIYAPEQGLFPRYTAGKYQINDTVLYVSRGLGNTIHVPRVCNTPELCVLDFIPDTGE